MIIRWVSHYDISSYHDYTKVYSCDHPVNILRSIGCDLRHRRQGRRRPDRRVSQGVEGAQALLERGAHLVKRGVILNQKCRTRNGSKLLWEVFGGFKLFANHDLWGAYPGLCSWLISQSGDNIACGSCRRSQKHASHSGRISFNLTWEILGGNMKNYEEDEQENPPKLECQPCVLVVNLPGA